MLLRKRNYDYSLNGFYFITTVVKGHFPFFGDIRHGSVILNDFGRIARSFWSAVPDHFTGVGLDEYCIMPDHIHGIICINRSSDPGFPPDPGAYMRPGREESQNREKNTDPTKALLPKVIQQYKAAVSREINSILKKRSFYWERSFHDYIIKDERMLWDVRNYIRNNPAKWELKNEKR